MLGNILALAITTALQLYVDIKISDTSIRDNSLLVVNYVASTKSCSSKTLIDAVNKAVLTSILTNTLHEYGFVNATANILPSFISTPTSTPTFSPTSKYKEYPKVSPNLAPFCFVKVNDHFAYPFLFHFGVEINEGNILAVAFTKPYSWSVFVKMLVSTALLTASISTPTSTPTLSPTSKYKEYPK